MEIFLKALAVYLLIGVIISVVGGAWKPLTRTRTYGVRIVQISFLIVGWLPALMAAFVTGKVAKEEKQ